MNAAPRGEMGGALVLEPSALARIREVQAPGEADLVTEMKLIKHPFKEQGIRAQPGIEF